MKKFELAFVLGEDLTEPKAKSVASQIHEIIKKNGGKVENSIYWGKKRLAYPIQKNSFGYYFIAIFEIAGPSIEMVTRDLNMEDRVIRHLITQFYADTELPAEKGLEREAESKKAEDEESPEKTKEPKEAKEKKTAKKEVKKEEAVEKKEDKKPTEETTEEVLKKVEEEQDRKRMMDEETRKTELEKRIAEM